MANKKEQFDIYCENCGRELIRVPKPANKLIVYREYFGEEVGFILGEKYNKKTGHRQFGVKVMCPNSRWWNNCTAYIDENSLHDSDLPELCK